MIVKLLRTRHLRLVSLITVLLLLMGTFYRYQLQASPAFDVVSKTEVTLLPYYFNEPSGIVYHPSRKSLFVAGDTGRLYEIRQDGILIPIDKIKVFNKRLIKSLRKTKINTSIDAKTGNVKLFRPDYEGITVNPETGYIYLLEEAAQLILEVTADRTPTLLRVFDLRPILSKDIIQLESLTFVPDPKHNGVGLFYLPIRKGASSVFYELKLPLSTGELGKFNPVKLLKKIKSDIPQVTGLHYDQYSNSYYAVSNFSKQAFQLSPQFKIIKAIPLPKKRHEGITVDPEGTLYVTLDYKPTDGKALGRVMKIKITESK